MERFELEDSLKEDIRARALGEGFVKIVQTVRRNGETFRISIRPVEIGGRRMYQAEMAEGRQVRVKNFDAAGVADGLEEIIAQKGARTLHLLTAEGDLHVRVTRKGHAHVSRSAPMERDASVMPHDRVKSLPLASFDSAALLKATGLADGSGAVKASMRGKYDQVNEFLRAVKEAVGAKPPAAGTTFTVVDCGCGKAYLTIAMHRYLTEALGFGDVKVIGVDRRGDVIAAARQTTEALGISGGVEFVECDLSDFGRPGCPGEGVRPDLVVSLHACDTATDEALAKAVEWGSKYILSAPCWQHELHKSLAADGAFAGLLRHGILRERLGDILTDAFRAMILRILGYRTQVVEFVSPGATARNILLRATSGIAPGQAGPVGEYLALRDYWHVVPWLETRLGDRLARLLERYG